MVLGPIVEASFAGCTGVDASEGAWPEKLSCEEELPDCELPWPDDDWAFEPVPGPPLETDWEVTGDVTAGGEGATGAAGAGFFDNSGVAEVNGAWITDAIELETVCRVEATKLFFCSANAVIASDVVPTPTPALDGID